MKRIGQIAILILLLSLAGCKSKEVVGSRTQPGEKDEAERFDALLDAYSPWETFTAKGTASFSGAGLRSSIEIRMIRGEAIQVSIRPLLGIEIGRLLMTTDSVYIYDKFNRRYVAESLQTFYNILPVAISPLDLQNILLGQPFIFGQTMLQPSDYKKFDIILGDNEDWALQPQNQYREFTYRFLLNDNNLMGIQAYQNNSPRQISCSYADHRMADGKLLPTFVQVTAQGGSRKYTLNINYDSSSATWDNNIGIEKLPTAGYTIMTFSQLLKSLIP